MSTRTKHAGILAALAALSFTAVAIVSQEPAPAEAGSTITITNEGGTYTYAPAQLDAKAGEGITVTNKDPNGVHSVTAKDQSFSVDVPPQSSVTLTVKKPGNYPYYCTYHTDSHNPASLNVS
jgi:plastocyanin